ncbi:MAG: hypothetical protein EHM65_08015 [Acidobacteriales bacterium]|nr:MAG: hypothetical protein EHM65_08015 [Terriglobales bacterium]
MQQNDSQLVIRDVPIFQWVFAFLFAGVGTLVINQGGPPVFGGIFAAVGVGFLLFSSVLTITADRITRTLKLDCRSALRHTLKQVHFDEIAGINVERNVSGGKRGFTYRLTLLRKDGQVIPFRSSSSSGWKGKERRAVQLREFLGIQDSNRIPAGILPAELLQAAEIHETTGVHWRIQPMYTASYSAPTGVRWHSPDFKTPGIFLFVAQKAEGQPSRGFLASLGSMFIRQALSLHGFSPEDTPALEQAVTLAPLEPALERHFMAYTNSPSSAHQLLNSRVAAQLADWAARYPLKQLQRGSGNGQLMTLFGPNGVYLATLNLLQPDQAHELVSLGVELVKSQSAGLGQFSSTH